MLTDNFPIRKDCLFGAIKLTNNSDPDKYYYSGYSIRFDSCLLFPYPGFYKGKTDIIFRLDNKMLVHINDKKKDILLPGKASSQALYDTTITVEVKYCINFSISQKQFT